MTDYQIIDWDLAIEGGSDRTIVTMEYSLYQKLQSRLTEAESLLNHANSHLELAIDIIDGKYLLEIESMQRTLAKIQAYEKGE